MDALLKVISAKCNQENKLLKNEITSEFNKNLKILEDYDKEVKNYIMILCRFYLENRTKEVEADIKEFIKRCPPLLYAYIDFWKIAKISKNNELGIKIAGCLSYLLQTFDYPNMHWVKANIVIAKSLIVDYKVPKYVEAKSILHQLVQVLPPLPLPVNSEYETFSFAENQMFYSEEQEDVVQSTSLIKDVDEDITEEESVIGVAETLKLPIVKVENPQLDYVKKVKQKKKLSVFEEHMAFQIEVKREFRNSIIKPGRSSLMRVIP